MCIYSTYILLSAMAEGTSTGWIVPGSKESVRCVNPVRSVVEVDCKEALEQRDQSMELINTSTGDPTRFGTLPVHPAVNEAVIKVISSNEYNGYWPSNGIPRVREAVAQYFSRPNALLTAEVIMCCYVLSSS